MVSPVSTRRALVWSFAERYAGLVIAVASTMVLSRLLSPAQVGIYSLCAAFTAVAGTLRDFGVSEYIIQEKNLTRSKMRAAYGLAFSIAWTIGLVLFLSRHVVAGFYNEPQVADVLSVLSLHFLLLPVSSPTFALLNRELAFRQIFGLQLASNAAQAVACVSMAFAGWGVMSLAWGPIVNVVVQALALFWMRPSDCFILPSFRGARDVLRFGSIFVASKVIEVSTRNFHDPVVAKQFDFSAVGLFSRAFGLIDLFHNNVGSAVVRVATPAFAAQSRAGVDLSHSFSHATAIFACVSWTFFGFVALMAEPIISIMFGHQWTSAAPLAVALAVSTLPQGLFALAPQMLSATGHVGRRLRVSVFYSPMHIVLVLLAAQFSLLAVACVWFVSNFIMMVMYFGHLRDALNMRLTALLAPSAVSAAVAGISVLTQFLCLSLIRPLALPLLVQVLLVLLACLGSWILAAKWLSHPIYPEIANVIVVIRSKLKLADSRG